MHILIIGGGAAGYFAAIEIKRRCPYGQVTIVEGGTRPLAKVAITGGGRCNLTNSFAAVKSIESVYPRGGRLISRLFRGFGPKETYEWFENEGVRLVTQADNCVFPHSQDAGEIVRLLERLTISLGIKTKTCHKVMKILRKAEGGYKVLFKDSTLPPIDTDYAVITTGGSPRSEGLAFLDGLGLEIVPPVPSLFTFSLHNHPITSLTGTVVSEVTVGLCGTKIRTKGNLLITHRGLSGPSILKLSSHGARFLSERDYRADININWFGEQKEQEVLTLLQSFTQRYGTRKLSNAYPERLNQRLWCYLLGECSLNPERRWDEIGSKGLNRLASLLTGQVFHIEGKDPFKDEFVTCGGVALSNLNAATLESKTHKGLYFAGEVTDIDAVTGGFNLQAAWTMAMTVARAIEKQKET